MKSWPQSLGLASILTSTFLNSSCQTIRYKFGNETNGSGDEIVHSTWVLGLVEQKQLKTKNYCPTNVSKIVSERSIFNFIPYLNFVWLPRSIAIDCSDAAMAGTPNSGAGSQGSPTQNNNTSNTNNTNNNTINIQISPELLKKPSE